MSALAFLFLAACGPKSGPLTGMPPLGPSSHAISTPAAGISEDWEGVWGSTDSSAVYRFIVDESTLWMDAWDSSDGEWFRLEGLEYAGDVRVRTTMPSTDWTLDQQFHMEGKGRIRQSYFGMAEGTSTLSPVSLVAPSN